MNKITFPLKSRNKGIAVTTLHEVLAALGYEVTSSEKSEQRFGASTRKAVVEFQNKNGLELTGIVDQATAGCLNSSVVKRKKRKVSAEYAVSGKVTTADGAPAAGVLVQTFDRDVAREQLIGSANTDALGMYQISFTREQFKRTSAERGGPELFVRVSNSMGQVLAQSKTVSNAPRQVWMDVQLPSDVFVARGTVCDSDGKPRQGYMVRAFDRNVGIEDTLLGQVTTAEQGNYAIYYASSQLDGKDVADLVLSVHQDDQLLRTSDVVFNARPTQIHDFVITVTPPPEFRTLTEKIQPLLCNKIGIGGLAQAQIKFLGQKTGLDARKIDQLAQSHALAGDDQTLAAFYYGMLAQNMPTDPAALLQRPQASIQSALDRAIIFNQIPPLQSEDVDKILNTTLPKLRAQNLLKPALEGQKPSLGDLLRTMPTQLPEDCQTSLADLVVRNGIQYEQLPRQLESAGLSSHAVIIEHTLHLADITHRHLPLMKHLQQMTATDQDGSLRSLTELRRDQWIDLAYEYGVPAGTDQTPEAYASRLEGAVDALHPTAMLAARLNTGDLVIRRPGFEKIGTFLANNPDLDILRTNVPVYAAKANFSGVEDKDRVVGSLLKLQRIKRLSTSWDETGAMLNTGLESARDVVSAGATRFTESLRGQVAPERARLIYDRARQVHDISLFLMAGSLPRYTPTPIAAMGNANHIQESGAVKTRAASGGAELSPTLQSLFGSLDATTSDQSVLSPAAYYVDLLQFLNPKLDGQTRDPSLLKALLARRPDLVDLQLSSKNAETELPYIDLVLEILENAVALPIMLALPAGTHVEMEPGTDSLPKAVTDQLQQTSLGIIGANLKATDETLEQRLLTIDPAHAWADAWIVSDKQRHWNVQYYHGDVCLSLIFYGPLKVIPISRNEVDSAQFVHDLDSHTLSENVKNAFLARYPAEYRRSQYLYISDFYVSTVTPGRQWWVSCALAVRVLLQTNLNGRTGTLELQTPSGANLFGPVPYSAQSILAMNDGLEHNMLAGPLVGLLNLPTNLRIVANRAPDGAWFVCLSTAEAVQVFFSPDSLGIASLAYQTIGNSEDLIACPENQNPLAYKKLRNPEAYGMPTFPWSLPFNLPWESVRAFLEQAGITRQELMECVNPENYLDTLGWTCDTLGICPEEATLIVNSASDQEPKLWSYWGFKPGPDDDWNQCEVFDAAAGWNEPNPSKPDYALKPKSKVSILLQQAHISYEELLGILRTYFVGGSSTFEIKIIDQGDTSDRGPCNLYVDGLTADHFDRIHRFVRLWRRLGWSIDDVDRAIMSMGGISNETLTFLAHIKKLQALLDVPPRVLVDWLIDFFSYTHTGTQSLYEQVFLNPQVQNPPDDAFLLNSERNQLINGDIHLDKAALIAAAVGIRQDELDQLLVSFDIGDKFSIGDLFELYRATSLARALGLSTSDYIYILRLTGAAPFSNSASLVKFCETVRFISNSGFTVQDLAYLLEQDSLAAQELDLNSQQASQMLKTIRSAMQARLYELEQQIRNIIANNPGGLTVRGLLGDEEALAADADSLHILFNRGDSASGVTRDLLLPIQGANGTQITWAPDLVNPDAIAIIPPASRADSYAHGIVTRPAAGKKNASATLTATVSIGDPPNTRHVIRSFDLVVLQELDPEDAVAADAASLIIRFSPGDRASAVTRLLVLPTGSANGSSITWTCSNANLIEIQSSPLALNPNYGVGYVHRPPSSESDAAVVLTATISRPDAKIPLIRTFQLTVLRELLDEQAVARDAASLSIGFADGDSDTSVSRPVFLPTSGANGTIIQWFSGNAGMIQVEPGDQVPSVLPATIDWTASDAELSRTLPHFGHYDTGCITRPAGQDADVVLTAVITRNNVSLSRVLYPRTLLNLDPLDARRLAIALPLFDPINAQGVNVSRMLRDVVISQVASLFNLEITVSRKLLTAGAPWTQAILHHPSDPEQDAIQTFFDPGFMKKDGDDTQAANQLMHLLNKVSLILSRLRLRPAEIAWIDPSFGMLTLDFNQLPLTGPADTAALFRSWKSLVTLFRIRDLRPHMDALLRDYVAALPPYQQPPFPLNPQLPEGSINPPLGVSPLQPLPGTFPPVGPPASPEDWVALVELLGHGLGLPKEWDYEGIAGVLGMTDFDDCRDPQKIEGLFNLLVTMRKLGATIVDVKLLTAMWSPVVAGNTEPDTAIEAQAKARALLHAKYGADSWNGIIKPISDVLRVRQRDALVDFLIFTQSIQEHPIKDANDLYEYYLIDPQMSPCMLTSRLVQATAAVQLFVQRCLLNLETVTLNDGDRQRWEWMKNYRVWEANRKVFLYPENWLYPELRDDKTETFKVLESGISQGEPNDKLAKDNMLVYIDEIAEFVKITVYGMYVDSDSGERVLYIVGRTPDLPHKYYWRKCTAFGNKAKMCWTGWERIELDLSDDHVMPFVFEGNFQIAWPTITMKTEADPNDPDDASKQKFYWEIQLNWARLTSRGWTKKKVSKETMPLPGWSIKQIDCQKDIKDAARELTFKVETESDHSIAIKAYYIHKFDLSTITSAGYVTTSEPSLGLLTCQEDDSLDNKIRDKGDFVIAKYRNYEQLRFESINGWLERPPATFTLHLWTKYLDLAGQFTCWVPCQYPAAIAFYYVTDLNDLDNQARHKLFQAPRYAHVSGDKDAKFDFTLDWNEFENPHELGPRYLARVDMGYATFDETFHCLHTYYPTKSPVDGEPEIPVTIEYMAIPQEIPYNSASELIPIGKYKLTAMGDILLQELDHDPVHGQGNKNIQNNGYQNRGTSGPLELPYSAQQTVAISAIQPSIQDEYFLLRAAPVSEGTPQIENWYYTNINAPAPAIYFQLDHAGIDWLGVYDNILNAARLRVRAYKCFDGDTGLYSLESQTGISSYVPALFSKLYITNNASYYSLTSAGMNQADPTVGKDIGFNLLFPASLYHWEIFYHVPMLVSEFLTKQQRFEDAQKWLHYIFNPTKPTDAINRFWQFMPFREPTGGANVQALLNLLAEQAANDTALSAELNQFIGLIEDWRSNPFLPFRIARPPIRWQSFQWRAMFAYLDNLIAWGDQMFRRFTRESVNEAIQYYVLASKLLGPRPKNIRAQTQSPAQSYRELYAKWDDFSNAWNAFEGPVSMILISHPGIDGAGSVKAIGSMLDPGYSAGDGLLFDSTLSPDELYRPSTEPSVILSSFPMLYFGVPPNDKLMGYWDTIEDRLLKIRTCKDIEGVRRELSLFSPPIDPLLLIRAAAAGLDIDTVLSDMDAPLLPYRFNILVQKASEICSEVKALGSALLSVLEKKDAEQLALLRSGQEVDLLNLVTQAKQYQLDEANANIESLKQSNAVALARFAQFQKLLGNINISFGKDGLPLLQSISPLRTAACAPEEAAGLALIQYEIDEWNSLDEAHKKQEEAGITSTVAGILHAIPESQNGAITSYLHMGGMHLGNAANAVAGYLNVLAGNASQEAKRKGMLASYQRRQDEWVHQSMLAREEMKQIQKQIIAAEIRRDLARKELANHRQQIVHAQAVDDFMHDKYTNQELYSWMMGQISAVYFRCYQLAYDTARRAEKAFRNELGLEDSVFIQFGYWDSLKKGLLAGENLSLDLKRMEMAYLERNRREFEISKHISLLQLDPLELIRLKETGACEVCIPEALFDIDFPGHYFRRIKSVSITIPCVAGPYTSVNCTLRLLKHSYRRTAQVGTDGYARKVNSQGIPTDDNRFVDPVGGIQSIATSHGQNDSGVFELNFRDERYLPFEGAGAISTWRIELPNEFRQFDYNTISDVVLYLKYTAREGGESLAGKATAYLKELINAAEDNVGSVRLFSVRHEFPTEWARFQNQTPAEDDRYELTLNLHPEHYPFWSQGFLNKVVRVDLLARNASSAADDIYVFDSKGLSVTTPIGTLTKDAALGDLLHGPLTTGILVKPDQELKLFFETKAVTDLWIAVTWSK